MEKTKGKRGKDPGQGCTGKIFMKWKTKVLMDRLGKKGLPVVTIPRFLRDVINAISDDPQIDLLEMNRQLHLLGWDAVELDYQTMQLILACYEVEGLRGDGKW